MANPPLDILTDHARFLEWQRNNPGVPIEARGDSIVDADLSDCDLIRANCPGAHFRMTSLQDARLRHADLTGAKFENTNLSRASLSDARIQGATFLHANLSSADGSSANFSESSFEWSEGEGLFLQEAKLVSVRFQNCMLDRAFFASSNLRSTTFRNCHLKGTSFRWADLTGTSWHYSRIDSNTRFDGTIWDADHDAPNDGSDVIEVPRFNRLVNWRSARVIGHLPLFAGAYILMTVAVSIYTGIAWLNDSRIVSTFSYPIPFPPRLTAVLWGSALLAVGTTIFEIACPPRVKEFSRTQWVEELRRPGILHASDSLSRPRAAFFAMSLMFPGAIILGVLFIERVIRGLLATTS
ncbi:MAG: pentapeptide repeat-containing protein [Gemmatimonadota bacterium]